jgi:hypothetical protein
LVFFFLAVRAVDGLLSPERFLTKICMVSSGSAEEAREETLEMLLERMVVFVVGGCKSGGGGGGDVKRGLMGSLERWGFVDVDVGVVAVSVSVSRSGSSWVVGGERERETIG